VHILEPEDSLHLAHYSQLPVAFIKHRNRIDHREYSRSTRLEKRPRDNRATTTMARGYSPPDSPLSSVESETYEDDVPEDDDGNRPTKRQRVGARSTTSSAVVPEVDAEHPEAPHLDGMSDISSDTSGDIPSSPVNARLDEEDFQDQVTVCDWDGCPAGDQGNMDKLVEHIHNSHIENRQKKYTCEWRSCNRKGLPHASGYALKAHMRSHTREKPFYCYLPGESEPPKSLHELGLGLHFGIYWC
jgi:hypothetical protein